MNRIYILSTLLFSTLAMSSNHLEQLPILQGPYLGQKPPGLMAEVFAPGIVSTEHFEACAVFAPDMKAFYYLSDDNKDKKHRLISYQFKDNLWHKSVVGPRVGEPTFSPDGKIMHLGRRYMERIGEEWSEVKSLGPMIDRKDWGIMRLSASAQGTYVFDDANGGDVIRISKLINGKRQEPQKMGPVINSGKWTAHPFIAPDESYLIWDSQRKNGYGESDLYISFRQKDGSWGAAINMGENINSPYDDAYGSITPDGKYLFFYRDISPGNLDIYWADAQIIEKLRLKQSASMKLK